MGCLSKVKFKNRMVIKYCTGASMYVNVYGDTESDSRREKGLMSLG